MTDEPTVSNINARSTIRCSNKIKPLLCHEFNALVRVKLNMSSTRSLLTDDSFVRRGVVPTKQQLLEIK